MDPTRAESLLGEEEATADLADEIVPRYSAVLVQDLGVADRPVEVVLARLGHRAHGPEDVESRRALRHDRADWKDRTACDTDGQQIISSQIRTTAVEHQRRAGHVAALRPTEEHGALADVVDGVADAPQRRVGDVGGESFGIPHHPPVQRL